MVMPVVMTRSLASHRKIKCAMGALPGFISVLSHSLAAYLCAVAGLLREKPKPRRQVSAGHHLVTGHLVAAAPTGSIGRRLASGIGAVKGARRPLDVGVPLHSGRSCQGHQHCPDVVVNERLVDAGPGLQIWRQVVARVGGYETEDDASALQNGGDGFHGLIDQVDIEQCGRDRFMQRQRQGCKHRRDRTDRYETAVLDYRGNLHPDRQLVFGNQDTLPRWQ